MTTARTFGRLPTLGEMREYYARDDVLSFLYDECRMRNIDMALRRKRWSIEPTSKAHLREMIDETIKSRIERVYSRSADPFDNARLGKFEYLSFHARTSIFSGRRIVGFDAIFEADMQGWRRAFEDLCGIVRLLDDFGVCYRIKYSGVRSLHFMIPFESFPKQFNGESVLSQRMEILGRMQNYFRRRCGMKRAHGGGVMRLAYSLNEDNGLVSIPVISDELSSFRPWEANIQSVKIDKTWHGDIPAGADRRMLKFLREIHKDDAKSRNKEKISCDMAILPKDRSKYAAASGKSSVEEQIPRLKSDSEADRVEAAWNIMTAPEAVPASVLEAGLSDENADVRWFMTESLQKRLDDGAALLAGKMLWDEDQFVRISAIDALTLSGENALQTLTESISAGVAVSMGAFSDVVYAIQKLCADGGSEMIESFAKLSRDAIAQSLLNALALDQPLWPIRTYIQGLRELCKQHNISESMLFRGVIEVIVPQSLKSLGEGSLKYHHIWILREIRKNSAIPLIILREIADSLGIDSVKIPSNRMTAEERKFLAQTVSKALEGMSAEQRLHVIRAFWRNGRKRMSEPSKQLLLRAQQTMPSLAGSIAEWLNDTRIMPGTAVGELAQEKSIDELVGMLEERSWRSRFNAAGALAAKCKTDEEISKVVSVLDHKIVKTRGAALRALGMMSHQERARKAIVEAMDSRFRDIRCKALTIYINQNPPDAVDVLLQALERCRWVTELYAILRAMRRYADNERLLSKLREVVAAGRFSVKARQRVDIFLRRTTR